MDKKIVYIAHAIGGDVKGNLTKLLNILRKINLDQAKFGIDCENIVPVASYVADVQCLNDNVIEERKRGIENNEAIIKSGIFHELWLVGDFISYGMQIEVDLAKKYGIPVVNYIDKI